jgi:hypothetical protein
MQEGNIDNYISMFRNLAKKALYDEAAGATIDIFARGLMRTLLNKVLDRETLPTTLEEWATAARKEQQCFATKHSMMGQQTFQKWPSHWQNKSKPHQQK